MLCAAGWLIASALGRLALGRFFQYLHTLGGSQPATVALCLAAVFLLVGVPSAFLGAVFPVVLRWGGGSLATLGSHVGGVLLANTLGAIAGSFVSGFFSLTYLGLAPSLLALAATYALLATPVFTRRVPRALACLALAGCLALLCVPSVRRPILWFNGGFTGARPIPASDTLFLAEGPEGAVGVIQRHDVRALTVNGVIVAETSQNDLWDLLLKAHLPMLLHEQPRSVAIVGLGAGVSLGAIEAYDVRRIDCAEISEQVVEASRLFADFNHRCWEDDRLHMWINDGRHFLLTTSQRYDVINVDPVDPPVCNQYTREFFQLCYDRLNPGGLMVQWVPLFHLWPEHLRVILGDFLKVFPDSTLWYDGTSLLLIGRHGGPLRIDLPRFWQRANEPGVRESLAMIGQPHPLILLATYVGGPETLRKLADGETAGNTDDVPYIEYRLLLAGPPDDRAQASNLEMLAPAFEPCKRWLPVADLDPQHVAKLRQARALLQQLLQVRILTLRGEFRRADERLAKVTARFELQPAELKLLRPFYRE